MAIATSNPTQVPVQADEFAALRERIEGTIVTQADAGYEDARQVQVVNFNRKPRAIVRVASTSDVAETVRFARERGMPLAVRSGGHSVPGLSMIDDGVTVDLSGMKAIVIDPIAKRARVQAGNTSGDLMGPAHEHGLALSTGDTTSVGLGGLVTGGGIGFMSRKHGLAIDNLLSAQVVTADGEVRTASPTENADLFWGIRGGGGNFGVVTEFEFQLAAVDTVLAGAIVFPASREVVRGVLDYVADAPEGLTVLTDVMMAPPAPFIPEDKVGTPIVYLLVIWDGDPDEGQKALAPLRALGDVMADTVDTIPYPAVYEYTAELAHQHGAVVRSMFSDEFSDDAIDAALEALPKSEAPVSILHIRGQGGAIARVPSEATAFAHRTQKYFISIISVWFPDDEDPNRHVAWASEIWEKVRVHAKGVYVNFLQDEWDRLGEAYPAETLRRLHEVKTKYDPENMFRYNQNIKPE
jgi:FAD/FMN-containing dehydrogenase